MPEITFDIYSIITVVGIFTNFLFITILLKRKANHKANRVLSLLLAATALSIYNSGLLYHTNLYYYIPHATYIAYIWGFLSGPLFMFYIRVLTDSEFKFNRLQYLHFLPLLIFILVKLPYFLQSGEYKIDYMNKWINNTIEWKDKFCDYLLGAVLVIHFFSYIYYSIRKLKKYQHTLKDNFSSIDKLNLSWIRVFISIFSTGISVFLVVVMALLIFKINVNIFFNINTVCVTILSCILAYKGFTQPEIMIISQKDNTTGDEENFIYTSYRLDEALMAEYHARLLKIIEEKKLYLNPDLSINDLAKELEISRSYISQTLNKYAKTNFYDFINKYRADHAISIIRGSGNKDINITDVMLSSGFNSKSTFYAFFKKVTNRTPAEYIRQHNMTACNKPSSE